METSPGTPPDDAATGIAPDDATTGWLLGGDPAVRWQVLQDLVGAPAPVVTAERARVATQGWGAALLARQDPDGRWAGRYYNPKWTSTTYTLLLLYRLGLPPGHDAALRGVRALWDGAQVIDGGLTYADSTARYPEACITSMEILLASANGVLDPRVDDAVRWLLGSQLDDGGWNCESPVTGSRHGSFHTTISALEALDEYAAAGGPVDTGAAGQRGRTFFLEHRLLRSHRTGAVVDPRMGRFPFPPQWRFDVLRGLEHFRSAGADRDERLADGVERVRRRRDPDGRWPGYRRYPGRVWFELEEPGPSRIATLRALRVLRWWGRPDRDAAPSPERG